MTRNTHLWSSMFRSRWMTRIDLVDSVQRLIFAISVTNTVTPLRMSKSLILDARSKILGAGNDSAVISVPSVEVDLGRRCIMRLGYNMMPPALPGLGIGQQSCNRSEGKPRTETS